MIDRLLIDSRNNKNLKLKAILSGYICNDISKHGPDCLVTTGLSGFHEDEPNLMQFLCYKVLVLDLIR